VKQFVISVFRTPLLLLVPLVLILGCSNAEDKLSRHQTAGNQYMEQGQFREAVIEYRNAVQLIPESPEAHFQLGEALLKLGTLADLRSAFGEFNRTVQLEPGHLPAQRHLGRLLLLSGDALAAREKAHLILATDPENAEALLLLGRARIALNEPRGAKDTFTTLLSKHPDHLDGHLGLGRVLATLGELKTAEQHFQDAVRLAPGPENRLHLARFYGNTGNTTKARAVLEEIIQEDPKQISAYLNLSRIHLLEKSTGLALDTLHRLIKAVPDHEAGYLALGTLQGLMEKHRDAEATYTQGIGQATENLNLRIQLAAIKVREGKLDELSAQAEALEASDKGRWMGRFFSGLVALGNNQSALAIERFNLSLKERSDVALTYYYLAKAHTLDGNASAAKESFQRVLERDPDMAPAHADLTRLLLREGDLDAARNHIAKLGEIAPNTPDTLLLSGFMALADRRPTVAEKWFSQLVEIAPDSAEAHFQAGRARISMGRTDSGRTSLEKAVSLDPGRLDALDLLTSDDLQKGRVSQAEKRIRTLLEKRPDSAILHFVLGKVLVAGKDEAGAIKAAHDAIERDPGFLPAYSALGQLYARSGQFDQAIAQLTQAAEKNPRHLGTRMLLGVIHEQQGDSEQAVAAYKAALELSPTFAPAANNLAWLYASGHGNVDVALGLAQTAREHAPDDPSVADTLGWIYHQKGVFLKSQGLLDEALEKLPEHPVVLYHAGMNHLKREQTDQARELLNKALKAGLAGSDAGIAREVLGGL